jgi:hypothetical protein
MIVSRTELLTLWEVGWNCLFTALSPLTEQDLERTVIIRGEIHSVIEAVHRQLAHYASHVGQIVLLGRLQSGSQWQTLSIPKGKSQEYNTQMMGEKP